MSDQYKHELQEILSQPVDVENIGVYEDTVSNDLIRLIGEVGSEFGGQEDTRRASENESEDAVLKEAGLPAVDEVLDIIQGRIDMVRTAGEFMVESAIEVDTVITPSDSGSINDGGGGSFEIGQIGVKDRVQTVLYVLQKIGIDLDDVKLTYGQSDPEMVRRTSYYTIKIPSLGKVLQVCDEELNASYIFSTDVMDEIGISAEDLNEFSKQERSELIRIYRERGLGHRFVYQAGWAEKVEGLLQADESQIAELAQQSYINSSSVFDEISDVPEGYLSILGFSKELRIAHSTLVDILKDEKISLDYYLFTGKTVLGIPPLVQNHIRDLPRFQIEEASEGVISVEKFGKAHQTSTKTILRVLEELKIVPGEYMFRGERKGAKPGMGLTPEQQQALLGQPRFKIPEAPEDIASSTTLVSRLHVSHDTLREVIEELGIPQDNIYRFRTNAAPGFNPEQQARIEALCRERWPEAGNAITINRLAKEAGATATLVRKIVGEMEIEPIVIRSGTRTGKAIPGDKIQAVREETLRRRQPRNKQSK